MRPAANRRVRCVSSASSGGVSPAGVVIADGVCCCSLGLAVPRIEVRTPRRIPPACSRSTSPWSLPPRTFRRLRSATLPMSPFPCSSLLSYRRDLVPRGFAPLAGPYHRTSYEDVRWPTLPWALFPFEVAFLSFLSVRSSFDDAQHHRVLHVCVPPHSCASHPSSHFHGLVRRRSVPCPGPVRSRPELPRESDVFLVGLHVLASMPRRLVALPSRSSTLRPSKTSDSQGVARARLRRRFADPPSSCGVLSDTIH